MNNASSTPPASQDAPVKTAYQTPELVDYGEIAATTQSQFPLDLQNGSVGADLQN
jgi:hypothetical protein